ncbi:MAG: hypothetical protein H7Z71_03820, partial [Moraxellaceae bacterium]|nr:hypothetical protein [Pseudobdellovibrionaceae bacterium]
QMKLIITVTLLSFLSLSAFAGNDLCLIHPIVDQKAFRNVSNFIDLHPVKSNILTAEQIKVGQKIVTQENEFTQITFSQPYAVSFMIFPKSKIKILNHSSTECGPQIKLIKGRILSEGSHPEISDSAFEKCPSEITTLAADIYPTGTTYLVESGALVDAISELNGETSGRNNLVGVGETGTLEESSYERYSVSKGTIKIKLKRLSKNKLRNPIKYSKFEGEKSKKKKRNIAKNSKDKRKPRFLAFNEKVKLKAGMSMNVKRRSSMKKTQTAELEVVDPSGI